MILCFSTYSETTFTSFRVFVFYQDFQLGLVPRRSQLLGSVQNLRERSRKKPSSEQQKNIKKMNPTIFYLSPRSPKSLKNARMRAVSSLFPERALL
jgi:hypothetical protein